MMKKRVLFIRTQIFVFILLLFTACEADEIKETIELENEQDTEIQYVAKNFDLSILLEAENPYIRNSAESLVFTPADIPSEVESFYCEPDVNILPATESSITVGANGVFTNVIYVTVKDYFNAITLDTVEIRGNGVTGGSATILIGPHFDKNKSPRYLMIEYLDESLNAWVYLHVYAQEAMSIDFESNIAGNIPKAGEVYTITQLGDYPSTFPEIVRFRAVTTNDVLVSSNSLIVPPIKNTTIHIFSNEDSLPRLVYLQYYIDDVGEWVTFNTSLQLATEITNSVTITNAQLTTSLRPHAQVARINLISNDDLTGVMVRAYTEYNLYLNPNPVIILDEVEVIGNANNWYAEIEIPAAGPMNGWTPDYYTNIFSAGVVTMPGSKGVAEWIFEYFNGSEWKSMLSANQLNYYYMGVENSQSTVPLLGGTWKVKIYGYIQNSNVKFRATDISGTEIYSNEVYAENPGGVTLPTILNLTISGSEVPREVYLSYQVEGDDWKVWNHTNPQTGKWRGTYHIDQQ